MQIHVITSANAEQNAGFLDLYYQARHKVYADELRWVKPSPDGREHDPYDTEHAVHFVGMESGQMIAASRLVPTHRPHLLADNFAANCTKGLIRDARVAEWTRGFVVRERRDGALGILYQFCHAIMEYSLAEGITMVGGIQRTYWLPMWMRMGWKVHIIGEPVDMDGDPWVPAYADVSESALQGAARRAKVERSLLVRSGPQRPFVETPHPLSAGAHAPANTVEA
ncbi:MAG TPA: acyl-homoserine-lactone synthase [Devosia sp.]|jgi:acyl-homoserine lactone synthase|nr:acyl-homoserine-lactone synthase [Devosia sp.]